MFAYGLICRLNKRAHLTHHQLNSFIINHLQSCLVLRLNNNNILNHFGRPTLDEMIQRLMMTLSLMADNNACRPIVQEVLSSLSIQETQNNTRQWSVETITVLSTLIIPSTNNIDNIDNIDLLNQGDNIVKTCKEEDVCSCPICYDDLQKNNTITSKDCKHSFCQSCINTQLSVQPNNKPPVCAICRTQFKTFEIYN